MIQAEDKIVISNYLLEPNQIFPNNSTLPVLFYKHVWEHLGEKPEINMEACFKTNSWENSWYDGIYNFHHYHSTAHEVIGVCKGRARLLLGGDEGVEILVEKGDVIIIPAGVAHKNLDTNIGFRCLGAYPKGYNYDMNYGTDKERPKTDTKIKQLPLPEKDPIFGLLGPLKRYWKSEQSVSL